MAVRGMRRMASCGLRIVGSGVSSTRTSWVPYQQRAFMRCLPWSGVLCALRCRLLVGFVSDLTRPPARRVAGGEGLFAGFLHGLGGRPDLGGGAGNVGHA